MVLKSRVKAPDWSADANPDKEAKCRKHPLPKNNVVNAETDPWFYAEAEAAVICNGELDGRVCPFRERCLYGALENNEQSGVFGGLTPRQRRWIRKDARAEEPRIFRDEWSESENWREVVPSDSRLKELEDEARDREEEDSDADEEADSAE